MSWTGTENLQEGLLAQRAFLAHRVPSYARILDVLVDDLDAVEARVGPVWAERSFDAWYERPLLLLGGMRFEALREGTKHPLHGAIAAEPGNPYLVDRDAVWASLDPGRHALSELLRTRHIQTNETSRAVAWTWVASEVLRAMPGRRIALVDLGCSAGLNLVADRLPSPWVDDQGRPIRTSPLPKITQRLGLDLRPLDALDPDTATWLRACVWPGQRARQRRLDAALEAFVSAQQRGDAPVVEALGIDEAPTRLATIDGDVCVLAYQTIMRDYVPDRVKDRYFDGMRQWLVDRPEGMALWVELENTSDVSDPERITSLSVHLRSGGRLTTLELARTAPHPEQLFVREDGVRALQVALASKSP